MNPNPLSTKLDHLASERNWHRGSPAKPFTGIVTKYMENALDLSSAVTQITSAVNEVYYADGDIENQLKDLWRTILHTSKTCTRKHSTSHSPDLPTPSETHLSTLLRTLKSQPPPEDLIQLSTEHSLNYASLPFFTATVHGVLTDDAPGTDKTGYTAVEIEGWENLHAFLAVITKDEIVGLEDVGVGILRFALEERFYDDFKSRTHHFDYGKGGGKKRFPASEAMKLDVFVACAGIWAVVMGEELWERRGEGDGVPVGLSLSTSVKTGSEVEGGERKVSKNRWNGWIGRFQFLSLREDLVLSTRELAAEAAAVMLRAK